MSGARLTKFRNYLGLTQREAAERFGVGRRTWNRYETQNKVPKAPVLAYLAQHGLNITWLQEGEGPMLLEGEARKAHADLMGELAGDQEAAASSEARGQASMQRYRECADTLQTLYQEVGYEPCALWATVLQELMYIHSVTPQAVRRILETLKSETRSQGGNHHGVN